VGWKVSLQQNCVDNADNPTQYLVVCELLMLLIGSIELQSGPAFYDPQGKIAHGGTFMPAKKKAKKKKKH
jgi:hypothetical protein